MGVGRWGRMMSPGGGLSGASYAHYGGGGWRAGLWHLERFLAAAERGNIGRCRVRFWTPTLRTDFVGGVKEPTSSTLNLS